MLNKFRYIKLTLIYLFWFWHYLFCTISKILDKELLTWPDCSLVKYPKRAFEEEAGISFWKFSYVNPQHVIHFWKSILKLFLKKQMLYPAFDLKWQNNLLFGHLWFAWHLFEKSCIFETSVNPYLALCKWHHTRPCSSHF